MTPESCRCELTPERLDAGEPEVAAAVAMWTRRNQEALRARRERLEPLLRGFGLALSAAGALLSGWAVTRYPVNPCPAAAARSSEAFFQVMTPVFVVLGVVFWFLPRITAELRAWAPGASARAASRAVARLRTQLPAEVVYELTPDAITSSLSRPRRTGRTRLSSARGAIAGAQTICLFAGPPLARLLRVVWLAGDAERALVLAALEAAQVPVLPLEGAAVAPDASAPVPTA